MARTELNPSIRRVLSDGFVRAPQLARLLLVPPRILIAARHHQETFKSFLKWTIVSRETTNFTYDITERNKQYLAWFVSAVTGGSKAVAAAYIGELEKNSTLRSHLRNALRQSPHSYKTDSEPRYGRRSGWYALIRMKKPRVVVETGTDKGLGSIVMAAALARNDEEGFRGNLYTVDINPRAGWLLKPPYTRYATLLSGDSLKVLADFDQYIDIFVNDSDHSPVHEGAEYQVVSGKLSPGGMVIGDNAHYTTELLEFAETTGRRFLFFREEPKSHWYPGGGIGVAFR